jgi:hypothetical protein
MMTIRSFLVLSLAVAGCAAAACTIGRRARHLEQQRLEEDLHCWEDEGGNLAPSTDPAVAPVAPVAIPPSLAPSP